MKTTIGQIVKDAGNWTAHVQFSFPADEFTADEVKQIVQSFQAPTPTPKASTSGLHLSAVQQQVNKMMGVSDSVFAKYADRAK